MPSNLSNRPVSPLRARIIQVLLGHARLDTAARCTRVANATIRTVTSPLDRLAPVVERRTRAGA